MSLSVLQEMLTYRRPAHSKTERKFRRRYLLNLPGAFLDVYGNIHVRIGTSRTLWSAHTDTVHTDGGRQRVERAGSIIGLDPRERSNCLGADCTVGVYLLREMILSGVPGYYLFHDCEERGTQGSSSIRENHAQWLRENFDHAIALDRRGTGDVITHQAPGRTASDDFAIELAIRLAQADSRLDYEPCDKGIYTDTAEYADDVPECTNLSIGYEREHSALETADLRHVDILRAVLCGVPDLTRDLPVERVAGEYMSETERADWLMWIADERRERERERAWSETPGLRPQYPAYIDDDLYNAETPINGRTWDTRFSWEDDLYYNARSTRTDWTK